MKRLVKEYSFDDEQLNSIRSLAKELNLTETTAKLLSARGVDTKEKIQTFLHPGKEHFLSPYLMQGMKEGIELIKQAKEEDWNVAIFGDYDADGVCATSVMYYALKAFGIEAQVYIPERAEGYGLSEGAVDKLFEEFIPDLLITVDCGISNYKEVEYVKEQGCYVIVTDHHELPETLPDCICINPKFKDEYPYDNLCGAGVAFKVACALIGERAYSLLDFAALATVADSVPLLGENRDIVFEGLKRINSSPRLAFSSLLSRVQGEEITAQTLAFTIAPRINAAGRMGDAASALQLFLAEDEKDVLALTERLNDYNSKRQKCCDILYEEVKAKIRKKGAYGNVIMLFDDGWNSGFVGIVAARIAEEYGRPTLLFVKNGEMLKGSARSIDSVNIFEALKGCSSFIHEFGGHAQAAGINVTQDNFDGLEQALNDYIGKAYTKEDFEQKLYVSEEITSEFSLKLAHELNALEPYGVGHRKPLFYINATTLSARPVKPKSPHIAIKNRYIDLMYFNGIKNVRLIESDVKKQIVFECNCSVFRGKESVKGFIREVIYDGASSEVPVWRFNTMLQRLAMENVDMVPCFSTKEEINAKISEKRNACAYGLLVVANQPQTVKEFSSVADLTPDLIYPSAKSTVNTLLLSPAGDADLSGYRDIFFLDRPSDYNFTGLTGKKIFVNSEKSGYDELLALDTTREELLKIFSALRQNAGGLLGCDAEQTAVQSDGLGFPINQFIFALLVFEELGLISYETGMLVVYRGVHADLNDSKLYKKVVALQQQ